MRLTIIIIGFILIASYGLSAQGLLDKPITLGQQTSSIADILLTMSRQGDFVFTFSNEIQPDRLVSIPGSTKTVKEWLDSLFGIDVIESIAKNNRIVLRRKRRSQGADRSTITIHGHITDSLTGEALIGASVFVNDLSVGLNSNAYGFYSLTLPAGAHHIQVSFVGYEMQKIELDLDADQILNIQLNARAEKLNEVVVVAADNDEIFTSSSLGRHHLTGEMIREIPALAGEVDLFRALQLLPGVKNSGELSSNISVRGGGLDQNMILLDEAPVYNPAHAIGIFSIFNTDAINSVELYKGTIPAEFGGRLSSVVDVRMKDGNLNKVLVSGSLGTISSRLTVQGPIQKGRSTFQVSGRYTYSDAITQSIKFMRQNDFRFYFYDLNFKVAHTFNARNKLFVSAFSGEDVNRLGILSDVKWNNTTATLRWNHIFNNKLFSNTTALFSQYNYTIRAGYINPFSWMSKIQDVALKIDFTYFVNHVNTMKFGWSSTHHGIYPGRSKASQVKSIQLARSNALEHALYVSDEIHLGTRWLLDGGLRFSMFQNLGPAVVYHYSTTHTVTDTVHHQGNTAYKTQHGFEPRISLRYTLNENSSLKVGYARTYQYVQLLANSALGMSPFDTWYPSGENLKPQKADQVSIGYFKTAKTGMFEFSAELYYKWLHNQVDFADHAQLLFNQNLEGELRFGQGYSYGAELLLKKNTGTLTGWASYTYARAKKIIPEISSEAFNANYDQPHSVTITGTYKLNSRIKLSGNWVYSTGRPTTLPVESFGYKDYQVPIYAERNSVRLPDYHRLDLSLTIHSRINPKKRFKHDWVISVYNVYARKNPLIIFTSPPFADFKSTRGNDAYAVSVLPFIPSVAYNFKF